MSDPDWYERPMRDTCEVDDVEFVQPVGFVWFSKPRYRVKAKGVKR
jgi:hypothetical protein